MPEKRFKHAYPGSFDPWTKGHQSVVESFLKKDPDANVEIIIGKNPDKRNQLLKEADRAFLIRHGIAEEFRSRIKVSIVEGVIADYMYEQNIPYFIKGVRDEKDFREEVKLAGINSRLFGAPMTLLLPQVDADFSDVSSSNLKLLGNLGIPMDRYANAFTRELLKMKTSGKLFIGVTGGIASGKSTFCNKIWEYSKDREIGIEIINMDALGHTVLESAEPNPLFANVRKRIAELFGNDVLNDDGTVNRHLLGGKVFGNQKKLDALTNLLSEPILYLLAKKIRLAGKGIVLIESAILLERNITELVDDNIIHVHTDETTQIARMEETRGMTESQARKRIGSQLSAREIKEKITTLQKGNFDRLYLSVDTGKHLDEDEISEIYENLANQYNRRREARRTEHLFIPGDIVVKDVDRFFREIRTFYESPERGYHNLKHIGEMLNLFQIYRDRFTHPNELYLAILLHDAIYDAAETDNEQQSAQLAKEFIPRHIENEDIDVAFVTRIIELTAAHGEELTGIDEETGIFLDMDMAILASTRKRLLEYEKGVYEEFSAVYSREEYNSGRKDFLKSLLDKKTDFFHTELFRDKYGQVADVNITYLLSLLQ